MTAASEQPLPAFIGSPEQDLGVESVAARRGSLAMEAVSLCKDYRLGRGQVLHAVRDVSFSLYRGAVVALVGESGSGKSTVAKLLAGQEQPTSGTIRLDGEPGESAHPPCLPPVQEQGAAGLPGPVRVAQPGTDRAAPPRPSRSGCTRAPIPRRRSRPRSAICLSGCT